MAPQPNLSSLNLNGSLTPQANNGMSGGPNSMIAGLPYGGDANYDFFDPQHWMLDGLLDFNYTFSQPLEGM